MKKCGKTTDDYRAMVFLDGKRATGINLKNNLATVERALNHTRISSTEVRPFVFGALKLTGWFALSQNLQRLTSVRRGGGYGLYCSP